MSNHVALVHFTGQLALLVRVGVPIHRALEIAGGAGQGPFRQMAADLATRVSQGETLSQAMHAHPQVFDDFFVRTVQVGEESGSLVSVLERLSEFLERSQNLRSRLVGALAYPALLLTVSAAMLSYVLYGMLPHFLKATSGAGLGPPHPFTAFVTTWLANPRVAAWAAVILLGILQAGYLTWRSPEGRAHLTQALLGLPGAGAWLKESYWAGWSRNLAMLLGAGLDLHRSLRLLSAHGGLGRVNPADRVLGDLAQGTRLSRCLSAGQAPIILSQLVTVGEATGRLSAMLTAYANLCEEDLRHRLDSLLALLEPALLGAMGVVVGIVVLAAMLPVIQLVQA
ncbi:MAG: type II secretion system F family protein [Candidatus Eremiobacterota bacterium]